MADFISAGFSEELFWTLTPRQYLRHLEAYAESKRNEHNAAINMAWLNAAFYRAEKLPKVEDFLLTDGKTREPEISAEAKDARIAANLRAMRKRFTK